MTRTAQQSHSATRPEDRPSVFISYCREDKEHVDRLIADLTAAGFDCWIDTSSIKGGEEWVMAIADGIIKSDALVPVITAQSLCHKWVKREIVFAEKFQKPIIPWVLEDVARQKESFLVTDYQWVTLFDRDYPLALSRLLDALPSKKQAPAKDGDTRRRRELVYLERLGLEELIATERYTPMAGASERKVQPVEMRAVFELLPMSKARQVEQERRRFENAVEEILKLRRAVLLGEPGGGKTTTIWKLAAELADAALKDSQAPIPLLIRLGRWTDAEQSLPEFIASQLGELGEHLEALLQEKRAALLLDGLNEMPASQHKAKYAEVQQFIEQHPKLLAVVSCRELDYTIDLEFDRINITPLDPVRIREFAIRYLGEQKGDALFWELAGQEARDQHQQFMAEFGDRLPDAEQVFWIESQLPQGFSWGYEPGNDYYWWNWLSLRERPSSLMMLSGNPYMLLMLTSVYAEQGTLPENRGGLFELFVQTLLKRERISAEEQMPLTDGLAKVAYAMQVRRTPAKADAGNALTVLPRQDVADVLGERLLYLAGSASILSMGEQVRFTHQLLQEYFAAKFMDGEIRAGRLKAADIWPPDHWWERTNWEEAAVLLAGLYSDDCSRVVEWIAEANPEIAAQCVVRSGAALAETTKEKLRDKWIPRLTDLKHDPEPKARAAVGRALGLTGWDNRKGVGVVEINGVKLPDIEWIKIPEGEFQYGDAKDQNAAKLQQLWLPEFYISRFPVTYSQFQCFVDDPEGIADENWFEGLTYDEDERRMSEQFFRFDNHPRETVSWYQAVAFCRWLSWRLDCIGSPTTKVGLKQLESALPYGRANDRGSIRLPTEFEWEKAARGTDRRLCPYKGEFDPTKANSADIINQTNAVGIFPNGASFYGVEEMSGNVWEWCLSDYDDPKVNPAQEKFDTAKTRVLRGGSWGTVLTDTLATYRFNDIPDSGYEDTGFRVVFCSLTSVGDGAR